MKISSTLSAGGTGTGVTPGPEGIKSDEEKALIKSAQVKAAEDRICQEREAASQLLVTSTIAAIVSFGMQGAGQGAMSAASTATNAAATSTEVTPESGFAKVASAIMDTSLPPLAVADRRKMTAASFEWGTDEDSIKDTRKGSMMFSFSKALHDNLMAIIRKTQAG